MTSTTLAASKTVIRKISKGFILPSAAFTIRPSQVKFYKLSDKPPQPGDVVYGIVSRIGQHSSLENAFGRIHIIHDGTKAVLYSETGTPPISMKD